MKLQYIFTPRLIPFHFKIDAFRQAGEAGEAGEAGGERKIICMADFVKWYNAVPPYQGEPVHWAGNARL
ncbi:hypothetical protein NIES4103_64570 [Nostoc sp. NIES-4103]|nr:hypothetical protein NIES4103_64570 [Nostoc sp. NIES-4103]